MEKINQSIIDEFVLGSHDAYRIIFNSYYSKVRAFALGFLKNQEDANEVSQLVFIKLWNKRVIFSEVSNFDAYLFKLVKYTMLNYVTQQSKDAFFSEEILLDVPSECTPLDLLERKDLQLLVDMMVEKMPPKRKEIFILSRQEGLCNDDIAQRLGINKKTVENHLNLALKSIKKVLPVLILAFYLFYRWGKMPF